MTKTDIINKILESTNQFTKTELKKMDKSDLEELLTPEVEAPAGLEHDDDYSDDFDGERVLVDKDSDYDFGMSWIHEEVEDEVIEVDLQFKLDKEQRENKYNLSKAELRQLKRTGLL